MCLSVSVRVCLWEVAVDAAGSVGLGVFLWGVFLCECLGKHMGV